MKKNSSRARLSFSKWPASNRPVNNNGRLPNVKDQCRNATPPHGSGKPEPAPAFKQEEEEDRAVAPRDQQPPQQHKPQAALGQNGQDPSVTPFVQGIPVDTTTEALDGGGDEALAGGGGGVPNPQTTVLRKHIVWAG